MGKAKSQFSSARAPFGVDFCVTDRCNLACTYCSVRHAKGAPRRLGAGLMKRALDTLSADPVIRRRYGGRVDVEFTGGEPLLEFDAVREAIAHIRARKMAFDVAVSTNGTLLTPDKMAFLAANDVRVYVSVDGPRRANDLHRKFRNAGDRPPDRSVFDVVMENLGRLARRRDYRERICVSATFTRRTLADLPEAVDFFARRGFERIELGFNVYEIWGAAPLRKILRATGNALRAGLRSGLQRGGAAAVLDRIQFARDASFMSRKAAPVGNLSPDAIALFHDGRFYPCDLSFLPLPGGERCLGDINRGLDFGRFDALCSVPEAGITGAYEISPGLFPPLLRYRWGKFRGLPRAKLDKLMADTAAVNKVFDEELGQYVKLQTLRRRLLAEPGFEERR